MNDQQILTTIQAILSAGCGLVIQYAFRQFATGQASDGQGLSPFAKRWAMIGLNVVVPTALYGLVCIGGKEGYDLLQNVAYVGLAFLSSQGGHSFDLPRTPESVSTPASPTP